MPVFIKSGEIYFVPDEIIQLPESRLPGRGERKMHEGRTVLIIQGQRFCDDDSYPPLLVLPVSTKIEYKRELDYFLPVAESGLKHPSVVITGLIQPVLKSDLQKKAGKVDAATLQKIYKLMLIQLGILQTPGAGSARTP